MARSSFYVTTPIYYVNAAPAPRARVHDDRRRRAGPPSPPARRGRLLPDGHRRARRAGEARRRARGRHARRAGRPQLRALPGARAAARRDATTSSSARATHEHMAKVQEVLTRVKDNGHAYEGAYEGWYCPRCADFKTEREIAEGNTCPIHKIPLDARAGAQLVLPPVGLRGAARAPVRRAPGLRPAARRATTRRCRSSAAACRTSRSRAAGWTGASASPGTPSRSSTSGSTRS